MALTDGFALKSWVISLFNKASKKNNKYSTDETVIGTWIDGKPIYRKVFKIIPSSNVALKQDTWTALPTTENTPVEIDQVISGWLLHGVKVNALYGFISANATEHIIYFMSFRSSQILEANMTHYAILEYTKTTDKATL